MGGSFSGRRARKKRVVELCESIDTADLNRWGLLKTGTHRTGSLEWGRGEGKEPSASVSYSLAVETEDGKLWLKYQIGPPPEQFDYPVRLVTTSCHLGGVRWWFICPLLLNSVACGRRVRKLYLRGNYFGCRHCHNLAYRSSQQSDGRVYAAVRGGLDLERFEKIEGMSISRLGFALKLLSFEQKRIERLSKRSKRAPRKGVKRSAQASG